MEHVVEVDDIIRKITTDEARHTATFIFVGAGSSIADQQPKQLRLPSAWTLRRELLEAHYGTTDDESNLKEFETEFNIPNPTPDKVWQQLIRFPARLEHYNKRIFALFDPKKPVPPAYYLLARWYFLEETNVGGFATTNFDLQLPQAFRNIASALNKPLDRDYGFAEIPQDFVYLTSTKHPSAKVIQRLHGTLARPWSIVAGAKGNINALSNVFLEEGDRGTARPLVVLRRLLEVLDPEMPTIEPIRFAPYEYLKESLRRVHRVIFIGYSFQDVELSTAIQSALTENHDIIVVDTNVERTWPDYLKADFVKASAELFLRRFVTALRTDKPLIMLPASEKRVLRDGPMFIAGYPSERVLSGPASGEHSSFLDPVYGEIDFSNPNRRWIISVVDTGELQRLRQIKQLSFVNLKHHGATHDRFSHSLGVAYLADRAFAKVGLFPADEETTDLHLAFTIAALIHDIGHGPFGHTMDLVRRQFGDTEGHEDDTGRIYQQIFNSEQSFADLDLALNDIPVSRDKLRKILEQKHPLGLVLSNGGCDIDRLDFVMRDAAFTIASIAERTGAVRADLRTLVEGYDTILDAMCVREVSGKYVLCFQSRVRALLDVFARLYCRLYESVYYSWQNVSARLMLAQAVVEMLESQRVEFESIKPLTDIELLAALEDFENPRVNEMAYLVKYRRLYPIIGDVAVRSDDEEKALFSAATDQEVVEQIAKLPYRDTMLVARLPSKRVICNFVSESNAGDSYQLISQQHEMDVELGSTPARLMVFAPPQKARVTL